MANANRPMLAALAALCACASPASTTDPAWVTIAEDLPSALLSVHGRSADDVWAIGGLVDANGPLLLHWDGAAWHRVDTGHLKADLWWAWLDGDDAVWFAGSGGTAARYDRRDHTWDVQVLDPDTTLFGVWGSSNSDIWAVGSQFTVTSHGARAWRYDGTGWHVAALPPQAAATSAIFKVWGRAADDLWTCGAHGLILHYDGATWTTEPTGTTTELFTLSGGDAGIWAAGGAGSGTILRRTDDGWVDESPPFAPTIPGIHVGPTAPIAAGHSGSIWERHGSEWTPHPDGHITFQDLHAVWTDPDGGVWATGGAIRSSLDHGTLMYRGPSPPGAIDL